MAKNSFDKYKIGDWVQRIIDFIGILFDEYCEDKLVPSVYKYCIDVVILRSTPLARQSENLIANNFDYSFNLKIKNGYGLVCIVNAHAIRCT